MKISGFDGLGSKTSVIDLSNYGYPARIKLGSTLFRAE